jgi:hypothetical protein
MPAQLNLLIIQPGSRQGLPAFDMGSPVEFKRSPSINLKN